MRPLQRGSMDATLGPKPRGAIAIKPLEDYMPGPKLFVKSSFADVEFVGLLAHGVRIGAFTSIKAGRTGLR